MLWRIAIRRLVLVFVLTLALVPLSTISGSTSSRSAALPASIRPYLTPLGNHFALMMNSHSSISGKELSADQQNHLLLVSSSSPINSDDSYYINLQPDNYKILQSSDYGVDHFFLVSPDQCVGQTPPPQGGGGDCIDVAAPYAFTDSNTLKTVYAWCIDYFPALGGGGTGNRTYTTGYGSLSGSALYIVDNYWPNSSLDPGKSWEEPAAIQMAIWHFTSRVTWTQGAYYGVSQQAWSATAHRWVGGDSQYVYDRANQIIDDANAHSNYSPPPQLTISSPGAWDMGSQGNVLSVSANDQTARGQGIASDITFVIDKPGTTGAYWQGCGCGSYTVWDDGGTVSTKMVVNNAGTVSFYAVQVGGPVPPGEILQGGHLWQKLVINSYKMDKGTAQPFTPGNSISVTGVPPTPPPLPSGHTFEPGVIRNSGGTTGAFYTFVPVCTWISGGNDPFNGPVSYSITKYYPYNGQIYTVTYTEQYQMYSDGVQGDSQPGKVAWDVGGGIPPFTGTDGGGSSPPVNLNGTPAPTTTTLVGSSWSWCSNIHVYKVSSAKVTISASSDLVMTESFTMTLGGVLVSSGSYPRTVIQHVVYNPVSAPVYQIEGIPFQG